MAEAQQMHQYMAMQQNPDQAAQYMQQLVDAANAGDVQAQAELQMQMQLQAQAMAD